MSALPKFSPKKLQEMRGRLRSRRSIAEAFENEVAELDSVLGKLEKELDGLPSADELGVSQDPALGWDYGVKRIRKMLPELKKETPTPEHDAWVREKLSLATKLYSEVTKESTEMDRIRKEIYSKQGELRKIFDGLDKKVRQEFKKL